MSASLEPVRRFDQISPAPKRFNFVISVYGRFGLETGKLESELNWTIVRGILGSLYLAKSKVGENFERFCGSGQAGFGGWQLGHVQFYT